MSVTDVTDTSAIQPLINQFDDYIKYDNEYNHSHEFKHFHHPTIAELDHFKKSWFYDDWCVRFRKLNAFNALGTKGVIALPNTTFEEWLYWFQEWAIAWMDDYNQFKKMVYEALQLIEKHLEAIDKTLEDHEKRIEKIEDEIQDIYNKIKQLQDEIDKINNEIQDIYNKISNLQNQVNQNTQDIKNLANKEQQDIDNVQSEIDSLKLNLYPVYQQVNADNVGALNNWHTNDATSPHRFGLDWRWINNNDHTQGVALVFQMNRVWNPSYDGTIPEDVMQVDLTDWLKETNAQLHDGDQHWFDTPGSYWNNNQRAGLQYYCKMEGNIMRIQIDALYGTFSLNAGSQRYETEGGGNEWIIPTK